MTFKLVLDALGEWAASQPNQNVWTFLDDKGEFSDSYTYQVGCGGISAIDLDLIVD
jgi:hypothetical protein